MIFITGARIQKAVLTETYDVWFRRNGSATYEEFVAHIGCEASAYSEKGDQLSYLWYASDDDRAKFYVHYVLRDDEEWELYGITGYFLNL